MISTDIAQELDIAQSQVATALDLLDNGNTVPFIARYRKEATGALSDTQLRHIEQRAEYLRDLADRKETILAAIDEQGQLTDDLRAAITLCESKARLEDLYLPYKKRRKTKADKAREAGLEPLTDALCAQPEADPEALAADYVSDAQDYGDSDSVLAGARAILIDRFTMDADLVGNVRETMYRNGSLVSNVVDGKEQAGAKFRDYFDFREAFTNLPSHRVLALLRAESEGVVQLHWDAGDESVYEQLIADRFELATERSAWLAKAVRFGWRTKLQVSAVLDVRTRLKAAAEESALGVFATNLRDVLLAAPAGQRATLGLDPGYRNGVKCAVVNATGTVVDTAVVYPHQPQNRWDEALERLSTLYQRHEVELLAVGNGTASRETKSLADEIAARSAKTRPQVVTVSETGASVYSASALAAHEFPDLDVSLRGAVSIARRLQDPLAELVKIDPKSIGVGQYQHDVNQTNLARTLDGVVEDAVNSVGVDVNSASGPLLQRVAGITATVADNIVAYRDEHGRFSRRQDLLKVPRLGPKAYEQAAGFLRIRGGDNPLDASAVHPESYPVVAKIATHTGIDVEQLIGNSASLAGVKPQDFADEGTGVLTVRDILAELDKPGRDPRPEFRTAHFAEGVTKVSDLRAGMIVDGTVTNVAAFGAFVDVGVHQDGLVHISAMSHSFVSDPRTVVRSGDVVKVKVLDVDVERQRIGLSLRLDDEVGANGGTKAKKPDSAPARSKGANQPTAKPKKPKNAQGSMAEALRNAGFGS